jgi:hypothetical protein
VDLGVGLGGGATTVRMVSARALRPARGVDVGEGRWPRPPDRPRGDRHVRSPFTRASLPRAACRPVASPRGLPGLWQTQWRRARVNDRPWREWVPG